MDHPAMVNRRAVAMVNRQALVTVNRRAVVAVHGRAMAMNRTGAPPDPLTIKGRI